jgi:hypothetical protein
VILQGQSITCAWKLEGEHHQQERKQNHSHAQEQHHIQIGNRHNGRIGEPSADVGALLIYAAAVLDWIVHSEHEDPEPDHEARGECTPGDRHASRHDI